MENTSGEKSGAPRTGTDDFGGSSDSFDKDLAAAIVPDHAQIYDQDTEQRVLRKIDLWLIPWMWIGYGFVYYDKVRQPGIQGCLVLLTATGHFGKCRSLWNDKGPVLKCG